jgi:hypothetical protein
MRRTKIIKTGLILTCKNDDCGADSFAGYSENKLPACM